MIFIILCIVPRVFSEVSLHHVYISRKSRSNPEPFETAYVSSQVEDNPETLITFGSLDSTRHHIPRNTRDYLPPKEPFTVSTQILTPIRTSFQAKSSLPNQDLASIEKANSKYAPGYLSSQKESDALYEHLKSTMHYKPPLKSEPMFGYENNYHVDDDDLRTSSRGLHDSWPFYYYNPYEYEHMRIDAENEKAKDKRFAVDGSKIIPIHEDLSDDIPYSQGPLLTTASYYTTTDNPISGHDPFFSVMLKDYFNKNLDYGEDQLTLKGIDWGNGEISDKSNSRHTRLPHDSVPDISNIEPKAYYRHNDIGLAAERDAVAEQGNASKQQYDNHEEHDAKKANDRTRYHQNDNQQIGFKNFVDNFANNFGSEDHKKDSKYILRRNQDKGENRKGFRRVYHKDEYQEDNEFYDNNNNSVMAEDKGSSNAHVGGSQGLLQSISSAKLGNQVSAYDKSGDEERNKYEKHHNGYDNNNNHNKQFHRFRDVANQAAQINGNDYSTH